MKLHIRTSWATSNASSELYNLVHNFVGPASVKEFYNKKVRAFVLRI